MHSCRRQHLSLDLLLQSVARCRSRCVDVRREVLFIFKLIAFMSIHVIHVNSCQFMSIHVIHINSCHSCQFMSFISIHVIHVLLCHSSHLSMTFSTNSEKSGQGREGQICLPKPSATVFAVRPKAKITECEKR
jgi:hypothetical protein